MWERKTPSGRSILGSMHRPCVGVEGLVRIDTGGWPAEVLYTAIRSPAI